MKTVFAVIACNAVSILCVAAAGYICSTGKEGWGWFLFIGLLCAGSVKLSEKSKDD